VVIAQEHHLRSQSSVCEWNLGLSRRAKCRSYARHNLELDSCFTQGFHLLTGAAEDQWISGLQPDYTQAFFRGVDEQGMNLVLGGAWVTAALAHVLHIGADGDEVENFR